MKATKLVLISLILVTSIALQAQQNVIVDKPASMHSNTTTLEVGKVTLTDTETVLDMEAFFQPGWWIRIVSDSYLLADGEKYMIRDGEGIDLDSLFWMPASGEASFKLVFEPMPKDTKIFDFIESDCSDCFKIWGIDLVNERVILPEIPEKYLQEKHQEEMDVKWSKGKAVVSGQFLGYSPRYNMSARLVYPNHITGKEVLVPITLSDDGNFHAEIEMYSPSHLNITYDAPQSERFSFIAAPGEETSVLINLPEANRRRSRLHKESDDYGSKIMFAGYQSNLNEELTNSELKGNIDIENMMSDILGMSSEEYYDYIIEKYSYSVDYNNMLEVSPLSKKIMNMQLAFEINSYLMHAQNYLMQAYVNKNKISWEEAYKIFNTFTKHDGFSNYLLEIPYPYNDPDILLIQRLPYYLSTLSYISSPHEDRFSYFRYLKDNDEVKPEDREVFSKYLHNLDSEVEITPDSVVLSLLSKYSGLQDKYFNQRMGAPYLSKVWNIDDCFLFDLLETNKISRKMEDFYPLDEEQKAYLASLNPIVSDVILEENNMLLAKIEENKKKTGYTVLDVPEVSNEELFAEMIKPFEGKAVLVDVWATWCGPCRAANKAMEPLKAQLADQDVVFLYLAGEDSPINTWQNMITDLQGYHYRVNEAAWSYFRESLNARGVPTYIVLDKEGNQSFHSVGFPGEDTMKREILKVLEN